MEKVLSERKWLTQESRESAKNIIKKLSKKVHVGSQHSQQAEAKLIKRYENLKLSDNFLENTFALKKRRTQLIISDMLKNDMNQVSDMDIQAVYYVVNNSIHIPIAMLQPPVFYKGAPIIHMNTATQTSQLEKQTEHTASRMAPLPLNANATVCCHVLRTREQAPELFETTLYKSEYLRI
ncbi:uncharacterized protein LOC115214828 [Octopus sinensis]|uniref:Uncharacterized protein LOC115214828 n=1 Tax=Octopus sinensis TaxID=2607531 RepID=A0A6P7SN52_9MOLL|nr:uncharacterized protein LOC115214828 [Octopus sinensis]